MTDADTAPSPWPARLLQGAGAAVLGLLCCPMAALVGGLETRYMIAAVALVAALVSLPLLGSPVRIRLVMTIALSLGLSVGLSISFLHHVQTAGSFVPFAAGAEAVTISLSLLGTLGYIAAELAERGLYHHRRPLRFSALFLVPQILFMLAGLLSLMNAWDSQLVFLEELRLLTLLLATWVTTNLTRAELGAYLVTLAFSVLLQAGLAGVQFATGKKLGLSVFGEANLIVSGIDYANITRPTGTLGDPNILSYFFEITAPVMLALFYATRGALLRGLFGLATLAAMAGMLVTYSRASWATAPLTLGLVTLLVFGRRMLSLRNALTALVLAGAAVAALVYLWPLIEPRLFGDDAGSFGRRWPLDQAAMTVLGRFPVVGVGLNNLAVSFGRYDATHYSRIFMGGDHVVHNLHLLVWTETGTVGFMAYLLIFGTALFAASQIRHEPLARALALGCAAGFFAHLVHGMVDPGFKLSLTISFLVFAQMGVIARLWLKERDARQRARPEAIPRAYRAWPRSPRQRAGFAL